MHSKRTDASLSCWGRLCWTELCRIWIRSHADVEERVPGSDRFDADLPYLFSVSWTPRLRRVFTTVAVRQLYGRCV
eukprot:164331-Pyramimonas_sp.AAC.1